MPWIVAMQESKAKSLKIEWAQFVVVVLIIVVYNEIVRQVFITQVVQAIVIQGSHGCAHKATHFDSIPTIAPSRKHLGPDNDWLPTRNIIARRKCDKQQHIREEWHHDSVKTGVPTIATQQHKSGGAIICLSTQRYRLTFLDSHRLAVYPLVGLVISHTHSNLSYSGWYRSAVVAVRLCAHNSSLRTIRFHSWHELLSSFFSLLSL